MRSARRKDITPRRSSRKRRSTAGAATPSTCKKPKPAKMPCGRSPGQASSKAAVSGSKPESRPPENGPPIGGGPGQEDFWKKMEAMLGGVEGRMRAETTRVREVLEGQLSDLKGKVESHEKRMDDMVCRVEYLVEKKIEEKLGGKRLGADHDDLFGGDEEDSEVEEIVIKAWGSPHKSYAKAAALSGLRLIPSITTVGGGKAVNPKLRKHLQYWERRRALRIRPNGDGGCEAEVRKYLSEHLKISSASMITLGLERSSFERVPYGPKSKFQKEMIVRFPSVETRYLVKGAARNLSSKGKEYRVRHKLPDFLKIAMSNLQAVWYEIRQRHPEARRNVRFDDENMDLVLDFSLREGDPWKTQAKQKKPKNSRSEERGVLDSEIDEILGRQYDEDPV